MNINKELRKGIFVSAIGKYSNLIINFIILAILSRLLTPSEFGIVAIINVFLIFFSMLIDLGLGPAIIQNKNLKDQQLVSIFSFSILLSIGLSILFALLAEPIAIFYENKKLYNVCLLMSLTLFTSGINMVPQAILLKQKKFLNVNSAQVISNIAFGFVGILLAVNQFSYYSIIIGTIIKNIVLFIIFWVNTKLKFTTKIKKSDLEEIYSFSKNQFLFNVFNYFSRNIDNFLIGKFISASALGYYDKAYTLSLYPNQILTNVITPVVQPIMSEYEDKKDVIKKTYLLISRILAFLGMPLTVFLYMSSKEIIYVLFGYQWTGSIITFKILALSIWIQMILSSTGSMFQSSNRTDLLLLSGVLSTILNLSSILVGLATGKIEYVAIMLVISFAINFIQANYLLMRKVFKAQQLEFYKGLLDPLIISILVLFPLIVINLYLESLPIYILFIVKAIVSLLMFILGLRFTNNIDLVMKILKVRH